MNEREAINALKFEGGLQISGRPVRVAEFTTGLDAAISALEEIQQYRKRGITADAMQELIACIEAEEDTKGTLQDLLELIQYRKIGTIEECRAAVEKQRAKKVITSGLRQRYCPACGSGGVNE